MLQCPSCYSGHDKEYKEVWYYLGNNRKETKEQRERVSGWWGGVVGGKWQKMNSTDVWWLGDIKK